MFDVERCQTITQLLEAGRFRCCSGQVRIYIYIYGEQNSNWERNVCCATRTREAFCKLLQTPLAPPNILHSTLTRVCVSIARFTYTTPTTFIVVSIRRRLVLAGSSRGQLLFIYIHMFISHSLSSHNCRASSQQLLRSAVTWRVLLSSPHCTCLHLCRSNRIQHLVSSFLRPLVSKCVRVILFIVLYNIIRVFVVLFP